MQPQGYRAFVPKALPPKPRIELDALLQALLSQADQAVGRLDGVIQTLPSADLFIFMYVRQEAVLSSQIEGSQSTLKDLLAVELEPTLLGLPDDVNEVVNYVSAMNYGIERLAQLPLSLRLIREIHDQLLHTGRGYDQSPGEFRDTQNWIGEEGISIQDAIFIPPPPVEMQEALADAIDLSLRIVELSGMYAGDHLPFTSAGIDSITIWADEITYINTPQDTLGRLQREPMVQATELTLEIVEQLAEPDP